MGMCQITLAQNISRIWGPQKKKKKDRHMVFSGAPCCLNKTGMVGSMGVTQ